jgi:hypothetical protein
MPALKITRYARSHDLVDNFLAELSRFVAGPSRSSPCHAFSAKNWVVDQDLDDLVLLSVRHTADDTGRASLLAHAAAKARDINNQYDRLKDRHMRALLARDAPELDASDWHTLQSATLAWILAGSHDGDSSRATRVQRRLQALRLYDSIGDRLREPAITDIIDTGGELAPLLAQRLGLTRRQLNALREATPPGAFTCNKRHDFEHAVRRLRAHAVPMHQWPGGGRPGQYAAWQQSQWLKADAQPLIRADYCGGADNSTVRDAVRAFNDDLLDPLLASLDLPPPRITSLTSLEHILHSQSLTAGQLAAIQKAIASVHCALVGPRGPKAFQEAAKLWHRRAAAVAALRNENQTERPGWPPLCPPWTSGCGHYRVLPLTTAKELVEEGHAHHHCVGTYYDACRSGQTQILSLRENGKPAVTAEILLDNSIASIRVGQFKGIYDGVPDDPALHQAMRDFLRDLRTGAHPLNRQELRAYRKWADKQYFGWSERPLSLAHARQSFPLYLALLPRGTPADFDLWCEQTRLKEGLRAALTDLAHHRQDGA